MNKKHRIRFMALCLAVMFGSFSLTACGTVRWNGFPKPGESTSPATEDTPSSSAEPSDSTEPQDTRTAADFTDALRQIEVPEGGLIIAAASSSFYEPDTTAGADILRAERAALVEQKLGASVRVVPYDADLLYAELYSSVAAGDTSFVADLVALPPRQLGHFVSGGVLSDLNTVPFVHLDAPYYHTEMIDATAVGRAVYGAFGSATDGLDMQLALYVNLSLLGDRTDALYRSVSDGTWTFDRLITLVREAEQNGTVGIASADWQDRFLTDLVTASFDVHTASTTRYGTPVYEPDFNRIDAAARALSALVGTDGGAGGGTASRGDMLDGKVLFYIDTLQWMDELVTSPFSYAVVPFPKADETQENYSSALSDDAVVLCVPASTRSVDFSGKSLELLFAASYGMEQTYLKELLQYTVHNTESYRTAATLSRNKYYDFGWMFQSGYPMLAATLEDAMIGQARNNQPVLSGAALLAETYAAEMREAFANDPTPTP